MSKENTTTDKRDKIDLGWVEVNIVRSHRKSIELQVDVSGRVTVRSPKSASISSIRKIINSKRKWLERAMLHQSQKNANIQPITFENGSFFPFFGKLCKVIRTDSSLPIFPTLDKALLGKDCLEIILPQHFSTPSIISCLKAQIYPLLLERVAVFAAKMDVRHSSIKLSNARRRWGSCSAKNSLNFNWRLVMLPLDVIDYLVVHELCHIIQKNHSREFWKLLHSFLPSFPSSLAFLKAHSFYTDII